MNKRFSINKLQVPHLQDFININLLMSGYFCMKNLAKVC
jgi:hypothetical protein